MLVLERAPEHLRGGNTYFTGGGFRFPYDGLDDIRRLIPELTDAEARQVDVGSYTGEQMYADMMRVSEGLADDALTDTVVREAYPTMLWMRDRGRALGAAVRAPGVQGRWRAAVLGRADHGGGRRRRRAVGRPLRVGGAGGG